MEKEISRSQGFSWTLGEVGTGSLDSAVLLDTEVAILVPLHPLEPPALELGCEKAKNKNNDAT